MGCQAKPQAKSAMTKDLVVPKKPPNDPGCRRLARDPKAESPEAFAPGLRILS